MGDGRKPTLEWNETFDRSLVNRSVNKSVDSSVDEDEDPSVHNGKKPKHHRRKDSGYDPDDASSEHSEPQTPEKKPHDSQPLGNEEGHHSPHTPKSKPESLSPPSTIGSGRSGYDGDGSDKSRGSMASDATFGSLHSVPLNPEPKRVARPPGELLYNRLYILFTGAHARGDNDQSVKNQVANELSSWNNLEGLKNLLDYLLQCVNTIRPRPRLNTPLADACIHIRKYVAEMRARMNAGFGDKIRHGYWFREMSKQTIQNSQELAFTLLFTLKNIENKPIEANSRLQNGRMPLPEYITWRGKQLAEKVAHCDKLKLAAACALGALAALAILVSVVTVVALLTNPTTAPVVAPIALWVAKFQVEAAVFTALYLTGEMIYALYNKCKHQPVLPAKPTTTTGQLLAAGVGVTGLATVAASVTAAFGYIPAAVDTVAATSGFAEAITGNAIVPGTTVAASSQTVAGVLGGAGGTLFGSILALARARNALRNAQQGTNDIVRRSAETVLELNKPPAAPTVVKPPQKSEGPRRK